ncbi:MAG: ABC transporter ATP-binding protein [Methanospirillaceae archaeon]|nr:ABC transporter ATP-binding protein [Methanospirillaceae archaeon]
MTGILPSDILRLTALSKSFLDGFHVCQALADVSFSVQKNEIVCLMGPSGCGKSTVLRIIAGLEAADSGTVQSGDCLNASCVHAAMIFQEHGLFPWLTVYDNIAYGLRLRVRSGKEGEIKETVTGLLALMHLEAFTGSLPHQLSGGMKQRVAIARALAIQPLILLMDEPFSGLDLFTRQELEDEILRIRNNYHTTFLFVTHNPEEAVYLADRIIVLSERPAVAREIIPVPFPHPRDTRDPGFIGIVRQITGRIRLKEEDVHQD